MSEMRIDFKGTPVPKTSTTKSVYNIKYIGSGLKYRKRIDSAIEESLKILRPHFKDDGWGLRWDILEAEIMADILGPNLKEYILARTLRALKNHKVVLSQGRLKKDPKNYSKLRKGLSDYEIVVQQTVQLEEVKASLLDSIKHFIMNTVMRGRS